MLRRPAGDGRPVPLRGRVDLRSGNGQRQLRHHAPGRRRHGPALSAALVLVADQRLVRSGGDGQLVRHLGLLADSEEMRPGGPAFSTHEQLLYTVAFTTVCWVATAFIPRLQTDRKTLIEFYRKVRPFGPGWDRIRKEVKLSPEEIAAVDHTNIPLALLGWVAGCVMIWSCLFTVGNYLYGRIGYAAVLGCIAVLIAFGSIRVMNALWA